jgi:hypothetical protein
VIEGAGHAVLFAGDTRLHDGLATIRDRLRPTTAILPVDGTRLRGGGTWVMDPDAAVEAVRILGVRVALPSHAEAWFSDAVARNVNVLATTVPGAPSGSCARWRSRRPKWRRSRPDPATSSTSRAFRSRRPSHIVPTTPPSDSTFAAARAPTVRAP